MVVPPYSNKKIACGFNKIGHGAGRMDEKVRSTHLKSLGLG
jgi:hypothetical protein